MNFTAKDKKILTFLGVFLAVFFFSKFFISPELKAISKLKKDINEKNNIYAVNMAYKEKNSNIESELKILNQKMQELKIKFPSELNYDEVYTILKKLALDSGIKITNMKFDQKTGVSGDVKNGDAQTQNGVADKTGSDQGSALSQPAGNSPADAEGKKIEDFLNESGLSGSSNDSDSKSLIKNGEGYRIIIKIMGMGKVDQITGFLKEIEALKNKVNYNQVQINKGLDENLNLSINLSFIGISSSKGINNFINPKGLPGVGNEKREDIFTPYNGYMEQNTGTGTLQKGNNANLTVDDIKKYDFTMRVMPYGDNIAPPTVSLTAQKAVNTGSLSATPTIYGDSSKQVNVDLYIEESKGKYSFKFKTDQEAFPDPQYIKTVEFLPGSGDIMLLIDSTQRKFLNDKSVVTVKLTNKTKKDIIIDVINEDKNNPRVKFENLKSNIIVNYK